MRLEEGQIWRKQGPYGWLKILQILDPEYRGYDGGIPGARVVYYPPQTRGIECSGGNERFVADTTFEGALVTWEKQITHNRYLIRE